MKRQSRKAVRPWQHRFRTRLCHRRLSAGMKTEVATNDDTIRTAHHPDDSDAVRGSLGVPLEALDFGRRHTPAKPDNPAPLVAALMESHDSRPHPLGRLDAAQGTGAAQSPPMDVGDHPPPPRRRAPAIASSAFGTSSTGISPIPTGAMTSMPGNCGSAPKTSPHGGCIDCALI